MASKWHRKKIKRRCGPLLLLVQEPEWALPVWAWAGTLPPWASACSPEKEMRLKRWFLQPSPGKPLWSGWGHWCPCPYTLQEEPALPRGSGNLWPALALEFLGPSVKWKHRVSCWKVFTASRLQQQSVKPSLELVEPGTLRAYTAMLRGSWPLLCVPCTVGRDEIWSRSGAPASRQGIPRLGS